MKSLKPRLLTAVVGITLLVGILILGEICNPIIGIIVGIACAFMVGEYLHAKNMLNNFWILIPCMSFAVLCSILVSTQFVYLLLTLFIIFSFAVLIINHSVLSYIDLVYAVFGTMLISFGMSALPLICSSGVGVTFFFCTTFALPWMADAGGFFIGASLGKHKLCPNISPKKTVEGALGGVAFCFVTALLIGLIFQFLVMPGVKFNFWALAVLGLVDAPVSILGDLSFSLIKRSLKIKDYGSIFPGHGGMLDRFDSIIFTAPVLVAVNQFIPFITLV